MGLLLEALEKANIEAINIYVIEKQVLSDTEAPLATRNRKFSTHSDIIESTDKRTALYKHLKFSERSFDGDSVLGSVVPIISSSKVLLQQIQQSTKQIGLKLYRSVRNLGNLRKWCQRNYNLCHICPNLAGVTNG